MTGSRMEKVERLRSAVRTATAAFIDHAPSSGAHGEVDLGGDLYLVYRRVDREYGVYIQGHGGRSPDPVALDKATERLLVLGASKLGELFDEVRENVHRDAESFDRALASCEEFVRKVGA